MTKRGSIKKKEFSLDNFKKDMGYTEVPDKELKWIPLSKAFQDAVGLPGIPKGYTALTRGYSDTGKSTTLYECAVSCQKLGILPIIIDSENALNREHLIKMGFDFDNDFYLIINNEFLWEKYGKKRDSKVKVHQASIEDLGAFMNDIMDNQIKGDLDVEVCFLWDSIGTLDCLKTIRAEEKDTANNNMWNAGALESTFKSILYQRIPASRKETSKYTNTFLAVQKVWLDTQSGGKGTIKHKGGEAFFYAARLILHHGGILTHGTTDFTAKRKEKEIKFGVGTNIKVHKNQITGVNFEGKIISTPHGFISDSKDSIDEYKTAHLSYFRDVLGIEGDFTLEKVIDENSNVEMTINSDGGVDVKIE